MARAKQLIFNILYHMGGGVREAALTYMIFSKYLRSRGYFESEASKKSIGADGKGIPWYTYNAIEFLEKRITNKMTVFEYGMGGSTEWWSRYVSLVISVDHDKQWFAETRERLRNVKNINLVLHEVTDDEGKSYTSKVFDENLEDDNGYADEILKHDTLFNIVVIDGLVRSRCTEKALKMLSEDGIIVFDNSECEVYLPAYDMLREHGFRELEFWGCGPCNRYIWKTSIFYRNNNCLGI